MAALRGELGFMPAIDLFRYLGKKGFTGTLAVRRGAEEKSLSIQEGSAIQASSTDPREFVGQILIFGGHLGEEEFEAAYQEQLASRLPLGQILARQKQIPAEVVRDALEFKIRETGIDLCAWREGEFSATLGEAPRQEVAGLEIRPISLVALADEAKERAAAWGRIRGLLPRGSTRLRLRGKVARRPGASKQDERILAHLDEPRSIDDLLLLLHATRFQLYSRLYALVSAGVLEVEAPEREQAAQGKRAASAPSAQAPAGAPPPRTTPPPLPKGPPPGAKGREEDAPVLERLAAARAALSAEDPEAAVEAAREALQLEASREVVEVLREAEGKLLRKLRAELVGKDLRPEALIDRGQLRELPLTPPARYLLTRMNGEREVGAIVRVAPMRELDALEVIRRLLRDGLIRPRPTG